MNWKKVSDPRLFSRESERRGGRSTSRSYLIESPRSEPNKKRRASPASIRWLRNIDRPPRLRRLRRLRGIYDGAATPPNLEIGPETPFSTNFVIASPLFSDSEFR